jgi:hypothetical protein
MNASPNQSRTRAAVIICSIPLLALIACTSPAGSVRLQGTSITKKADSIAGARTSDVLTGDEIRGGSGDLAYGNAYDAIMRLRTSYLRATVPVKGSLQIVPPAVFINGTFHGGADVLRTLNVSVIDEIRFVRSAEAMFRYGPDFKSGVILISTSQPRSP